MISRRNFMTTSSAGAGTPLSADTKWLTALGSSLRTEQNYTPRIEGNLPADLTGKIIPQWSRPVRARGLP